MKGLVKWFSSEKNHGFIVGSDGKEYYFHASDLVNVDFPSNKDMVEFSIVHGKK